MQLTNYIQMQWSMNEPLESGWKETFPLLLHFPNTEYSSYLFLNSRITNLMSFAPVGTVNDEQV